MLGDAATVNEALDMLAKIQAVMVSARGHDANVHLALEDAGGDSAIIEYIGGKPLIHHGRQFTIMTNDPTYNEQLALSKKLDFSHPSSDMPLPGNVNPRTRFQRRLFPVDAAATRGRA
jgi:penicillin V acylase-like amidase (Ntn superfamily)